MMKRKFYLGLGVTRLVRMFENGNVMVTGEKGSGKDVMFGNVIARIDRPYVSNVDYTKDWRYIPLDFNVLDAGKNSYKNFLADDIKRYYHPFPDGTHIYISDAGNYFPSQYTGQLDRDFPHMPVLFSLIRQLGEANIHTNAQAYERVWNKIREQSSDCFIRCDRCRILFGRLVFGTYYLYDKAASCEARVKPCRVRLPLFAGRQQRMDFELYKDKFYNTYGTVQKRFYICFNKSKHDTRAFRRMLLDGRPEEVKTDGKK